MHNRYKYFLLIGGLVVLFALSGCGQSDEFPDRPSTKRIYGTTANNNQASSPPSQPVQFCPQAKDLIKKDDVWATSDGRWKNFTHSSASKILSFLGAQWFGIKVGKVICLYQTNEEVAFPLAVEHVKSRQILEPSGYGWSALAKSRKFCKSASVADCAYFAKPKRDLSNIYKDIEYNPG